ncbi:MAG: alpha/beta hydrolase [Betaproteobacteria bacterium]|nr:MAG: alpha/beta hydrolase [Betaproteobacteria bacterium]
MKAVAALFTVVAATAALAQPTPKYKPLMVKTPDGLTISAQEWGNPNGPEILFIHGFSQAWLSWARQVNSDLASEFRMVTYDLRGHGNSDKPLDPARYKESRYWADEVQAIINAAGFKRPVLVGWSYGGRVIADYLSVHGTARLAGINYVDAVSKSDPSHFGDGVKALPLMSSEDLATNIAATREFLHSCFEKQPGGDDFESMLAFNMMVPPKVRAAMGGRQLNQDDLLKSMKLPVLVTHGEKDRAKLSVYPRVVHAPFYEDAARFNAELAAFVREANRAHSRN